MQISHEVDLKTEWDDIHVPSCPCKDVFLLEFHRLLMCHVMWKRSCKMSTCKRSSIAVLINMASTEVRSCPDKTLGWSFWRSIFLGSAQTAHRFKAATVFQWWEFFMSVGIFCTSILFPSILTSEFLSSCSSLSCFFIYLFWARHSSSLIFLKCNTKSFPGKRQVPSQTKHITQRLSPRIK